jgi:hypothetical protein
VESHLGLAACRRNASGSHNEVGNQV